MCDPITLSLSSIVTLTFSKVVSKISGLKLGTSLPFIVLLPLRNAGTPYVKFIRLRVEFGSTTVPKSPEGLVVVADYRLKAKSFLSFFSFLDPRFEVILVTWDYLVLKLRF